ncbi:MAG: epoxyqueuosine reductase QueH [Bacilli bacterium]|nr:epoxyqueuosine reductase QueH [Bacilli bacterium]
MNKNYHLMMNDVIASLITKPRLLLHACCAPCTSYVLELLSNYFEITIFYYNPNMNDILEYEKRFNEFAKLLKGLNLEEKVKLIKPNYDNEQFLKMAEPLANLKEGGLRCHNCYYLRLSESFKYALENDYDYVTTTLTVSPYKNAELINQIGFELEETYHIKYLPSDFKKNNGYKRSIELSKEFDLYRQTFCGCIYSRNEQ